ncbi:MAG TPA: c-type cytochrome [Gemmatimonadaceae bacterium]|nr:c-type cytochrome [Gemmatimonadaceae bacterium]
MRRISFLRFTRLVFMTCAASASLSAQAPGKFPPDSLVNTKIIPRNTPPIQVVGIMRNFAIDLGVRCQFCHVGREGQPLAQFDFASDEKQTKAIARQMMLMAQEINRRVDTLPGHSAQSIQVTCRTCHRGVSKPTPLSAIVADAAIASGADSALRAYRALKERYVNGDAYDFREASLNTAAFRTARANKVSDALALLDFNEQLFPGSSAMSVFRGNILLMRGDTTAAAAAFNEAIKRDSTNTEARGRLRDIGRAR